MEAFGNQWGLEAIRADVAYAEIALRYGQGASPGQSQTVGIIDSGIDQNHPAFARKTIFEEHLPGATDEIGDDISHGTAVAGVIVSNPSTLQVSGFQAAQGVAPGADVAMFAISLGTAPALYKPISLATLNSEDQFSANLYNTVINWSNAGRRLDFVNASFGYAGIIEQYSEQDLRNNFGQAIAALAQTGRSEKTVFIFSAGNANGDSCNAADFANAPGLCVSDPANHGETIVNARSPQLLAGLPARLPELRSHMIAVTAVALDGDNDGNYEIASFSNRCGIAAQWCIAAPGQQIRTTYFGPNPNGGTAGARGAYSPSGTSFAAPMVTGSLVVMKHAFRDQLSNTDLVARLLTTANNRGPYSDSDTYGRGLLDLGASIPGGADQRGAGQPRQHARRRIVPNRLQTRQRIWARARKRPVETGVCRIRYARGTLLADAGQRDRADRKTSIRSTLTGFHGCRHPVERIRDVATRYCHVEVR